jgi:hypothetical protein
MFTTTPIAKEFPMSILARLATTLQTVFGPLVDEAAAASKVIKRVREFTATTLAQTFTLGYLQHPDASDAQLARLALRAGVAITPSAIEQRHTPQLVAFLKALFVRVAKMVVTADRALVPLLERFTQVQLLDSSTLNLPPAYATEYPACGREQAALKLQTLLDLKTGALQVAVDTGRSSDNTCVFQQADPVEGSLRIADLGYYSLDVLATIALKKAFFLSRIPVGTKVFLPGVAGPQPVTALLVWLATFPGPFIDVVILLGQEKQLRCRLIAWRLPEEKANRCRHKVRQETRQKKHREPSAACLAWCDWTILVTNAPLELIQPKEAVVLYRARWQIELLFKRWKSQDLVATLHGTTPVRQMVRVWGRLVAALLQHWLVVASAWHEATRSWVQAAEACREFVTALVESLGDLVALARVLGQLRDTVAKTCRRNKRTQTGTIELLENPDLLDYSFN